MTDLGYNNRELLKGECWHRAMKHVSLLVWLTQLGLSVAVPPVVFIALAVWLRDTAHWGGWVLWVGIGLGIYCAVTGFVSSLRTLSRLAEDKKEPSPPAAFNEHE